ncbi:MAG: M14 family zinc carboxypeptidase, partial [Longimicrobiales bacterium]
ADLLRVLQKQAVEISRATSAFTVQVPVRRGRGGGRGGADSTITRASQDNAGATQDSARAQRTEAREFPAGSYIVRMDQPYSRIADALLDYQYWAPSDPQRNPYDDTGWTFPEGFGVQAVRVLDVKVLDVPVQRVQGAVRANGGVTGSGNIFAINHNADNALATLRYRFKDADFQAAEEPFETNGQKFRRGSFVIRNVPAADLDRAARELGINVHALSAAPSVRMHPTRAARAAILHTWTSTQTEGWWRQAFDALQIPFSYISVQEVAKDADLNSKYDVIVFPPSGGSILEGMPMWRNPMPWKNSPETPNIGTWAQTDDMRPGLGLQGLLNLQNFVKRGGVLIGVTNTAEFAITNGLTNGVSANEARARSVVGSLLRSRIVDETSPIVYGIADSLAIYSDDGSSFSVSNMRGGGRGGGGGGGGAAGGAPSRPTGRGTPDDVDAPQGRAALDARFQAPPRPTVQPWQATPITDEQLRNPLNVIPPEQRPRVVLRFSDQRDLLVSGLLDGGGDIAQRPVVIDAPLERG